MKKTDVRFYVIRFKVQLYALTTPSQLNHDPVLTKRDVNILKNKVVLINF